MKSAPPRLLWDNVKDVIEINENSYVVFDDTVLDKRHATEIETSQRLGEQLSDSRNTMVGQLIERPVCREVEKTAQKALQSLSKRTAV
ncbi:hypothetical protein V5G28_014345 [Scytonema sp. PRP1]